MQRFDLSMIIVSNNHVFLNIFSCHIKSVIACLFYVTEINKQMGLLRMTSNKLETRGRKRLDSKLRKDTTKTIRVPTDIADDLRAIAKMFTNKVVSKRDVRDLVESMRGDNDGKY